MPTSFSWDIVGDPVTGSLINPGPPVPSSPQYTDPRSNQFERGIKFGNVPGGNPDNITHGGTRIWHVNTLMNVQHTPSDQSSLSGVIRFANRRKVKEYKIPEAISPPEARNVDQFGNIVYPWSNLGGSSD